MERQRWIHEHCHFGSGALVIGSPNYVWERKLKNTKVEMKVWAKLSKENPISKRKEALEKLEKIQLEMQDTESSHALLEKGEKSQFNSF